MTNMDILKDKKVLIDSSIDRSKYTKEWVIECNKANYLYEQEYTEIVFLGDVILAGDIGDAIQQQGSDFLFKEIPCEFFNVDIICFNLECCLSNRGEVWEPKPYPLRGLPKFLSAFPRGRCNYIANVANNHFLDYGEDAALDTLGALKNYDMQYFGLSKSVDRSKHIILRTRAGSIGLIGFAPSTHPLPNADLVNLTAERTCDMVSQVNTLKQQSDIVIASLHHGVENTRNIARHCRYVTHRLVDAGADCIVCHHPHIIQGIETYKGAHIFHSIGNFIIGADYQRTPSARKSLTLKLLLHNNKINKIIVEPFIIMDSLQPRPATKEERQQIRIETEALSSMFKSNLRLNINYLKCEGVKIYDRVLSLYEMIRQKGIFTATKYYLGRIIAKVK
jgi:poly-gamma-glutamate synthesis protein (capsule biosynthesis protein)